MKRSVVKFLVWLFKFWNPEFLSNNPVFAEFREKVFISDINHTSGLEIYQKKYTIEIMKAILKYYKKPKNIVVLDVGCSAAVSNYLAGYVKRIIGINLFMEPRSRLPNVEFLAMDATKLRFDDKTFDFIFSADVYEHMRNLSKCIDEQLRVLKDGGYCYATWAPVWSSMRGHHIHEEWVQSLEKNYELKTINYKNNGTFIKDWSHLLLSKEEMRQSLLPMLKSRRLTNRIVDYIYSGNELSRDFFDDVEDMFHRKNTRIVFLEKLISDPSEEMFNTLKNKYKKKDFSTALCRVLFTSRIT